MRFAHYSPTEIVDTNCQNYLSVTKMVELTELRYNIGYSLLNDCTMYIGLHKFINFDDFDDSLSLMFKAIFTTYQSKQVVKEWLSWLPCINESIKENHLAQLKKTHPKLVSELVEYVMFKNQHYKKITMLLGKEITKLDYDNFISQSVFEDNYPHLQFDEVIV